LGIGGILGRVHQETALSLSLSSLFSAAQQQGSLFIYFFVWLVYGCFLFDATLRTIVRREKKKGGVEGKMEQAPNQEKKKMVAKCLSIQTSLEGKGCGRYFFLDLFSFAWSFSPSIIPHGLPLLYASLGYAPLSLSHPLATE